jgi:magnesium-transporting ATPase (P-type)
VIFPFNLPFLQSLLWPVGGLAGAVSAIIGFVLIGYYSDERSIRNHLKDLREAKHILAKLLRHLEYYDEQALRHLSPEQYMHQLPLLIASYRKRADRYRQWFVVLQIITIFLSAGITSLSGGWLDKYVSIPWIIPVLGALISILTSLTLFFKFREKGTNLQQTSDALDWEHMACTLGIGIYKGLGKADALVLLAERAEALRKEQQQRQLQLEQSSHAEQKALQSNT